MDLLTYFSNLTWQSLFKSRKPQLTWHARYSQIMRVSVVVLLFSLDSSRNLKEDFAHQRVLQAPPLTPRWRSDTKWSSYRDTFELPKNHKFSNKGGEKFSISGSQVWLGEQICSKERWWKLRTVCKHRQCLCGLHSSASLQPCRQSRTQTSWFSLGASALARHWKLFHLSHTLSWSSQRRPACHIRTSLSRWRGHRYCSKFKFKFSCQHKYTSLPYNPMDIV